MQAPRLKDYWKYNFTQTFWNLYLTKNPMARLMGLDFSSFLNKKKDENDKTE
jgi:hypothetical protein